MFREALLALTLRFLRNRLRDRGPKVYADCEYGLGKERNVLWW